MWPAAPTMFAVGVLLGPLTALAPSGRNLTALLPELRDLLGSLLPPLQGGVRPAGQYSRRWR
ncbi:hypothetical protein PVAP13_1KG187077 [Panicum virgatum]|uniref:Uncharacterized protein n=1 Tax=Panicum virgatum TaxID=38727 RepID=A0A8T0XIR0_PANVG|nr:hypothetical protein PVAP13_1KG187077 [Panicum virgatum]